MLKFFLLFPLIVLYLNAGDRVEVYATKMTTVGNTVRATGEVVVIYKDYQLSASEALYDRDSGDLELFDNVRATQGSSMKLLGKYAKMNIANKERTFKPFYMLEKTSEVWLSGATGYAKDDDIEITSGIMSGCNPNDPLWKMEFSSSQYNTATKWMSLYNTRLYIYDILVFYAPYFGYSLDTTRRTGLLRPAIGLSNDEGFYYEQPIYIAEQNWWDLELKPQIRTQRGKGIYSTFRFVDSMVSRGELTVGYFREQDEYFEEQQIKNQEHSGFNLIYNNSDVINQWFDTTLKGQSGLYLDVSDMNDVEYINLSTNDTTQTATATQILSRINLFYNNDTSYFGSYFKYYKDLIKPNNDATIQNLPSIHYHNYLTTFLEDHFLFNVDVKVDNFTRTVGKSAVQTAINIPLTLQTSLFDEYLNLSYKSYLYGRYTAFRGNDVSVTDSYNNGFYARNYHSVLLSSQQAKAYDKFTHTIDFGAQYVVKGDEIRDGYYEDQKDYCSDIANKDKEICEFYNISDIKENLNLYFAQYLYDEVGEQIIYQKLTQNISYENIGGGVGELENELDYKISKQVHYYNNMFYNYDEGDFSKNFNKFSYLSDSFDLGLSHMYQNSFKPSTITLYQYASYLTSSLKYRYNTHYNYHLIYDYDLEKEQQKTFEVGFIYKKRCWDFGLRYVENTRPITDINGDPASVADKYIYLTISLKPLMRPGANQAGFSYRLPDR